MQKTTLFFWIHLVLGLVHLATGIVQFCVPTSFRATVTIGSRLTFDGDAVWTLVSDNVNPAYLSGLFLLLAAADHVYTAATVRSYLLTVETGAPVPQRWMEYSVSASLMNVLIAMLCNVQDLVTLMTVAVLTALMMTAGYVDEDVRSLTRYTTLVGWVCFVWIWTIIFCQFSSTATDAPAFVWAVVFVLFVLEALFGVVSALSSGYHGQSKYDNRELAYAALSLFAKQSLAWIAFGGLLHRDEAH